MEKTAKLTGKKRQYQRWLWLLQAVLSAVLLYLFALKAIDTGKLQYYFLVFILLIFIGNRVSKVVRRQNA